MSAEPRALTDLAASIADGEPIDWEAAQRAAGPREQRLIRHLRLVSSVAELYRSVPAEPGAGSEARPASEPQGPRWGHLVLLESIGRGTSGEVHRAWDLELHREVALKLFPPDPDGAPQARAEVLSEARRLARVRHPNVAAVYGADRDQDRVGFWMELVHGSSLQDLLDRNGPFGARETAVIGRDLCGALAAVHSAGLLHRDIKAQNVLRETGGRIVLTDFGTGEEMPAFPPEAPDAARRGDRPVSAPERTGVARRPDRPATRMAGTPMYLAPEILKGQPASVQSDVYSLGVLLYLLLTGSFPIPARTLPELVNGHKEDRRRRLRDARPDLPPPLVDAVECALAPNPADRYPSAGAFDEALRRTLDSSSPAPASDAQPAPRRGEWRSRWLAAAAAVVLVAATMLAIWTAARWRAVPGSATGGVQSVAVLPLADLTGGDAPPHLSEALTDQIIATLGQLHGLRVTSRTSVMVLGKPDGRLSEIARRLGVASVLEGTVAIGTGSGGTTKHVRVNVRLIAAGTDTQLWSGTFERPLGDTFALQADLARAIAREVRVAVTPVEAARLGRRQVTSPEAEAAFFEGRHYLNEYGAASAAEALSAFERAARLDPNYAAAYVGMARSYVRLGLDSGMMHTEARARALAAAQRALELDDESAEAHTALADVTFYYDWNWRRAERSYERALDLNPSSADARQQFARYLSAMGRVEEAVQQAQRATEVDPLAADAAQVYGLMLYYARRYDEAAVVLGHAYELNPRSAGTHVILSRVREAEQRFDEALAEANKALAIAEHPGVRAHAARQMALAGHRDSARAELRKVMRGALKPHPEHVAYAFLALGETEHGLSLLEQAEAEREPPILWLAIDPRVESLRANPRFQALLKRIGLPEPALDPQRPRH